MSYYYYNKYYRYKRQDTRYYIPMTHVKVDVNRLKQEVQSLIGPLTELGYGITTSKKFVNEVPYRFDRHTGISKFNKFGERILPTGEKDEDVVFWPSILEQSYMKELGDLFSEMIQIPNPRVRLSMLDEDQFIDFHNDPHTPYRIHIALETHSDAVWMFKNEAGAVEQIHQPADGTPVIIETGRIEHAVKLLSPGKRIHLWYQFHGMISEEILSLMG